MHSCAFHQSLELKVRNPRGGLHHKKCSSARGWRDRDAEHMVGRGGGGRSDPEKKIVTSPKLGLFLGRKAQEACPSILQ